MHLFGTGTPVSCIDDVHALLFYLGHLQPPNPAFATQTTPLQGSLYQRLRLETVQVVDEVFVQN